MNSVKDWDPASYLKFGNERTRPSIDLVGRINVPDPKSIIDIGCGPGNSTEILLGRWPAASITGIDNSPAMIEKAKSDYPGRKWELMDASNMSPEKKFDVVFSNAAIQWIPEHEKLMRVFISLVNPGGAMAIQAPLYHEMPVCAAIDGVFRKISGETGFDYRSIFTFHPGSFYYNVLAGRVNAIEMWETSYVHVMDSCAGIIEMIKSTGLRPYIERIADDEMKIEFEKRVLEEIKKVYPEMKNGKVLFPFKRLFFVAYA
ncbi:MAG: methyltransferase domain-containing protein [Spirochaetes bacterium]|jgi:trans-aconitate 2-methyltransferase|nr:methyltransferase domain-containing protein [Spirochaetota bacterium]